MDGLPMLSGKWECGAVRCEVADAFLGSKAPWFEITDDLPQFDEYATGA